ncbi:TPA: hypothetical protein I7730_00550 [Vibrio vulnificus]|uniref:Uncharacterized protein n=1 Tax=Vibrio vulnificus TaxID=672 RepID=A0A8H9MYA1_VIBVL|nr:hypothetical protein [Vibrio vulnificus]
MCNNIDLYRLKALYFASEFQSKNTEDNSIQDSLVKQAADFGFYIRNGFVNAHIEDPKALIEKLNQQFKGSPFQMVFQCGEQIQIQFPSTQVFELVLARELLELKSYITTQYALEILTPNKVARLRHKGNSERYRIFEKVTPKLKAYPINRKMRLALEYLKISSPLEKYITDQVFSSALTSQQ